MSWTDNIVKRAEIRGQIRKKIASSLKRIGKELGDAFNESCISAEDIQINIGINEYKIQVYDRLIEISFKEVKDNLTKKQKYNMYSNVEDIQDDDIYNILVEMIKHELESL